MRTIVHQIEDFTKKWGEIPLYVQPIQAGFPSPAADTIQTQLNLHDHLVKNPASTFFMQTSSCYPEKGISKGDLLVIDRSKILTKPTLAIVCIENELRIESIVQNRYGIWQIESKIGSVHEFQLWGIITYVIHRI